MTATVPKSGRKPPEKRGSRKGVPNKTTKAIKDMVIGALADAGGRAYLTRCAKDPKLAVAFLGLVGRVLPLQIAGDANAPITVQVVTITSADEQAKAWRLPS